MTCESQWTEKKTETLSRFYQGLQVHRGFSSTRQKILTIEPSRYMSSDEATYNPVSWQRQAKPESKLEYWKEELSELTPLEMVLDNVSVN